MIIAREVANEPDLLIAVQPTRGLDVGAIEYVHKTLIAERDKGRAILLISLELDEVMNVSDTIAVLYNGSIADTFKQGEVDEKTIGLLMAGGNNMQRTVRILKNPSPPPSLPSYAAFWWHRLCS